MEPSEAIRKLEEEKLRLIGRYLELQDEADAVNERIYRVCVDIEILNQKIAQEREREKRAAAVAKAKSRATNPPPGNGSPASGSGGTETQGPAIPRRRSDHAPQGGEQRGDPTLDSGRGTLD